MTTTPNAAENESQGKADLILRNALLTDGSHVDIAVSGATILAVSPAGTLPADHAADHPCGGHLALPALGEPHAHLDKALTATRIPNPTGDLDGAVDAWQAAMSEGWFDFDDIVGRAGAALDRLIARGTTAVRTHVNVSDIMGATGVAALRRVADDHQDLADVEIVALTTPPMTGPAGAANRAALDAAMAAGADLVGGAPQFDENPEGQINHAIEVAAAAGCGLDLHLDETLDPSAHTLLYLARRVQETGFEHPVTASHCVSLAMQDPAVQAATAKEVAAAGIAVVTLPQTNLYLQGRSYAQAMPRALTALDALLDAGVVVGAGADNAEDPYNPVGHCDPLETAALMVLAGHRLPPNALAMVSGEVRKLMCLAPVTIAPGDPADLLLIDAATLREAVARTPGGRTVFHRGRLVASTSVSSSIATISGDQRPLRGM